MLGAPMEVLEGNDQTWYFGIIKNKQINKYNQEMKTR